MPFRHTPELYSSQQKLFAAGNKEKLSTSEKKKLLGSLLNELKSYGLKVPRPEIVITSQSKEAREWTLLGLGWMFGFNFEEAIECFLKGLLCAKLEDTTCPLAAWGVAHSLGTNYLATSVHILENTRPLLKSMHKRLFDKDIKDEVLATIDSFYADQALGYLEGMNAVTELEKTLIHGELVRSKQENRIQSRNYEYAQYMGLAYDDHADDLNFVALFAEAIVNQMPWSLYVENGRERERVARPAEENVFALGTGAALKAISRVSTRGREHMGIVHFQLFLSLPMKVDYLKSGSDWVHDVQVLCEKLLEDNVAQDCGHIVYMSSYIFLLQGRWHDVIRGSAMAIKADDKYVTWKKEDAAFRQAYTVLRCKHRQMCIYGAMMAGRYKTAIRYAARMEDELVNIATNVSYRVIWKKYQHLLELFVPMKWFVWVRFGKWSSIVNEKYSDKYMTKNPSSHGWEKSGLMVSIAGVRWARTLAHLYLDSHITGAFNINRARGEQKEFVQILNSAEIRPSTMGNNFSNRVLQAAGAKLEAEIAFREENYDYALSVLETGVELNDGLRNGHNPWDCGNASSGIVFDIPCPWVHPIRHSLGALLLEFSMKTGIVDYANKALEVYETDMSLDITFPNPKNVWALRGVQQTLEHIYILSSMDHKPSDDSIKLSIRNATDELSSALSNNRSDSYIMSSCTSLRFNQTMREGTLKLPNGTEICYAFREGHASADFEFADSSQSKYYTNATPLLLIHGFLDSWKSWQDVLKSLGSERKVIALSLRGFGDNSKYNVDIKSPFEEYYTIEQQIDDIYHFLSIGNFLDRNGQVLIAGHALGAMVAIGFSLKHEDMVKGIVLLNGAATLPASRTIKSPGLGIVEKSFTLAQLTQVFETWMEPSTDFNRGFIRNRHMEFLKEFQFRTSFKKVKGKLVSLVDEERQSKLLEESLKSDVIAHGYTWKAAMGVDFTDDLHQIIAPSVIIWGTNDTLFTHDDQKMLMEQMKSSKRMFRTVNGAGYGLIWSHPTEVADFINSFVRSF